MIKLWPMSSGILSHALQTVSLLINGCAGAFNPCNPIYQFLDLSPLAFRVLFRKCSLMPISWSVLLMSSTVPEFQILGGCSCVGLFSSHLPHLSSLFISFCAHIIWFCLCDLGVYNGLWSSIIMSPAKNCYGYSVFFTSIWSPLAT